MQRYTIFFITVIALHVSGGFSAHHQKLKNCTHSIWYVPGLQGWHIPDAACTVRLVQPDSARKRSHNLHEAYQLPSVQWITPDDGHRRCLKHAGFYDKNKFFILMHLVGYFYKSILHVIFCKCCWFNMLHLDSAICWKWLKPFKIQSLQYLSPHSTPKTSVFSPYTA